MKCYDDAYYLRNIHLSRTVQDLGGMKAKDSSLLERGVMGLVALGWEEEKIIDAIKNEFEIV